MQIGAAHAGGRVRLTKTQKPRSHLAARSCQKPDVIVAAGSDGTAIALVNALARVVPPASASAVRRPQARHRQHGRTSSAPKLAGLARDREAHSVTRRSPLRRFGLVDVGYPPDSEAAPRRQPPSRTSPGAGSSSPRFLSDEQPRGVEGPPRFAKSVYGYVTAMLTRTAPKSIVLGRPHVLVENLGDGVYGGRVGGAPSASRAWAAEACSGTGLAGRGRRGDVPGFGYRRAYPSPSASSACSTRVFDRSTLGGIARGGLPRCGRGPTTPRHARLVPARAVRSAIRVRWRSKSGATRAAPARRTVEMGISPLQGYPR